MRHVFRAALFLLSEDEDMNQSATGNTGQWRELMASVVQLALPNLLVSFGFLPKQFSLTSLRKMEAYLSVCN